MKKEREIFWTKPTPRDEDIDYSNRHTLTKEEEKKLFAGKLNHKDMIERVENEKRSKSKIEPKRKSVALRNGKPLKKDREILWTKPVPKGLRFDEKDLITLTKEEEKKLFAGKLNPKDVIERVNKEKPLKPKVAERRKTITPGKGKK